MYKNIITHLFQILSTVFTVLKNPKLSGRAVSTILLIITVGIFYTLNTLVFVGAIISLVYVMLKFAYG